MKALKTVLIAGVAATAVAGFASAASAQVAYNVGVATDYVFRGIDQSSSVDGSTAEVFGGVDYTSGPIYVGAWLSNAGPNYAQGAELDLYAGYKLPLGGATLDLGVITYNYSKGSVVTDKSNNWEAKAALSVPVGGATVGGAVYWTPDFGQTGEAGFYYEANAALTLANKATVSGAVGQQTFDYDAIVGPGAPDSYTTWNLGVTYPVTDKLALDARYIGVSDDATSVGVSGGDTVVATLKLAF